MQSPGEEGGWVHACLKPSPQVGSPQPTTPVLVTLATSVPFAVLASL